MSSLAFPEWTDGFLEKALKKRLMMLALVLSALVVYLHAETKTNPKAEYQTAIVVSVDKHVSDSNYIGSPTDAPLQANGYSYDIGVRLDCNVYVGRYESATDYLPSAFAPNQKVDVRFQKHIMYVNLPHSDREVKIGIIGHSRLKEQDCVELTVRRRRA